jgi:dihydrofolate reductase
MRRVRYGVAMSLDGYIAGPNGEYDWIIMDPEIPFAEMLAEFDTLLIGRKTFDAMRRMQGGAGTSSGANDVMQNSECRHCLHSAFCILNYFESLHLPPSQRLFSLQTIS